MTGIPSNILDVSASTGATDTSRLASKENLKAAADRFEAIFIGMMLKSMRATKIGDGGILDSSAGDKFRDMQDQNLAQAMASHAPLGLGDALSKFLARGDARLADVKVSATSAVQSVDTGGAA